MITEVMQPDYYPIVSQLTAIGQFDNWEGLDIPIDTPVPVKLFLGKEDFFRFYDITLLAGEWRAEWDGAHKKPSANILYNHTLPIQLSA